MWPPAHAPQAGRGAGVLPSSSNPKLGEGLWVPPPSILIFIHFPFQPTFRLGRGLSLPSHTPHLASSQQPRLGEVQVPSPHDTPHPTGFGRENTWIGLNDRIVERDFQWTDNTGLVSGGSLGAWVPAVRLLT